MASTTKTTLVVEAKTGESVTFGLTDRSVTVQTPRGKEVEITDQNDIRELRDALNGIVEGNQRPSTSRPVKDAPQA